MDRRTWIFVANRLLTNQEERLLISELNSFLSQWKSHGKSLDAEGYCIKHGAIVLIADEREVQASGCSIDKINHWVRSLGATLKIDFFDRFNVLVLKNKSDWEIGRFSLENNDVTISANIISSNELNRILCNN